MKSAYFADAGPLWAITSFYNPSGYARRRHNYRLFRHHLQVPLLTVELAYAGGFELADSDAEILVRCSGGDVLWQKERLLNVALERLPPTCTQVAWVDCDVLFERDDWAVVLSRQLERTPLVQPYSRALHLRRDAPLNRSPADGDILFIREAVAGLVARGASAADYLGHFGGQRRYKRSPGHVWAARREILQRHGLYDACITGGGDTAIASAAYGCPEEVVNFQTLSAPHARHYRAWAESFHQSVRGEVGWLEGDLLHLWHGEAANRGVPQRYYDLASFDFEPEADIAISEDGCWRWNSDKPGLHAVLREYFAARKEDGAALRRGVG